QAGAAGIDTEAGAGSRAVGQAHWSGSNHHVLVDRQSRTVSNRITAGPADHHTVSGGISRTDTCKVQAAAGLTSQGARSFVPLIAQARATRIDTETGAGSRAVGQAHRSRGNHHRKSD